MRLVSNWRVVLRHAWSVRLLAIAFLFSVLEVAWPYFEGLIPVPPRLFALLAGLISGGAFVARLVAQKGLSDADREDTSK